MRLNICSQSLSSCLVDLSRIADKSSSISILAQVKLEASNGELSITASNWQCQAEVKIQCDINSDFSCCVTAGDFARAVKTFSGSISLGLKDSQLYIVGEGGEHIISAQSSSEFPLFTNKPEYHGSIKSELFLQMLHRVGFAANSADTRPYASAIHIDIEDGQAVFSAIDGLKLARGVCYSEGKASLFVRIEDASNLKPYLTGEDTTIDADENVARFSSGRNTIYLKLSDGNPVGLGQHLTPPEEAVRLSFKTSELSRAVSRCLVFSEGKDSGVSIDIIDGKAEIAPTRTTGGKSFSRIDCSSEVNIKIGVSGKNLIAALSKLNSQEVDIFAPEVNGGKPFNLRGTDPNIAIGLVQLRA